jgi:hypothetical protein
LAAIPQSAILVLEARLRRLFSTFATGGPGVGLLLLRVAAGGAILAQGFTRLPDDLSIGPLSRVVLANAGGGLLVAGLWTPVAGCIVAICSLWNVISHVGEPGAGILLGSIGVALALLGPGVWSIDARLFGWRRINLGARADRL